MNRKSNSEIFWNRSRMVMGKLVIDGNKVYTVDEACMKRKNLTLAQIRKQEAGDSQNQVQNRVQQGRRGM